MSFRDILAKIGNSVPRSFFGREHIVLPEDADVELPFNVPFYSQRIGRRWQEMGFPSKEVAALWEWEACGIACLQIVLEALTGRTAPRIYDLIVAVDAAGGYRKDAGWIHEALAAKAREFGLRSYRRRILIPEKIAAFINQQMIVAVSVGVGFEERKKSGHLALVIGYKTIGRTLAGFFVHHPSALREYEWKRRFVDVQRFREHFSGNAIIFSKP